MSMKRVIVTKKKHRNKGEDHENKNDGGNDDVDKDKDGAGCDGDTLNDREIAADDGHDRQIAEARIVEDVLDHQHAADQGR